MGVVSEQLGLKNKVTPALAKRIVSECNSLAVRAERILDQRHVQVSFTKMSDGALRIESSLVPCDSKCPCKKRGYNE